jgi:hypothetical protein
LKKRFSDRLGITTPPTTLQTDSMNDALRNSLWNLILQCLRAKDRGIHAYTCWHEVTWAIAGLFLKVPLDSVPFHDADEAQDWLRDRFSSLKWYEIYNLLEFLVHALPHVPGFPWAEDALTEAGNRILEEELSAYRFIQGELVAISNPTEIAAIEEAATIAASAGLDGVHTHIKTALTLLGQKPKPDYRNSIKESISAVESAAKRITGSEKGELKDALALLDGQIQLHGALKKGFLSLYGYSSDADGIRHALLEETTVGFEEAKFMLVSCSAFATFLISKAASAGILKPR